MNRKTTIVVLGAAGVLILALIVFVVVQRRSFSAGLDLSVRSVRTNEGRALMLVQVSNRAPVRVWFAVGRQVEGPNGWCDPGQLISGNPTNQPRMWQANQPLDPAGSRFFEIPAPPCPFPWRAVAWYGKYYSDGWFGQVSEKADEVLPGPNGRQESYSSPYGKSP
jgi:hypothetical protein